MPILRELPEDHRQLQDRLRDTRLKGSEELTVDALLSWPANMIVLYLG